MKKQLFFCGQPISEYGLEHGFVDYRTLANTFNCVLCNDIVKTFGGEVSGEYIEPELVNGFPEDHSEEIEEKQDRLEEIEDRQGEIEDRLEEIEEELEESQNERDTLAEYGEELQDIEERLEEINDEIYEFDFYCELDSNRYEMGERVDALDIEISDLEYEQDELEGEQEELKEEKERLEQEIEELDDEEQEPEIFQYYIIDGTGVEILKRYTNEIVYYLEPLDMYVWGVTHYGTSWDYVLTDIELEDEEEPDRVSLEDIEELEDPINRDPLEIVLEDEEDERFKD